MKKYSVIPVILLWACLAAAAWFGPKQASSDAERRPLAQMPVISAQRVLNGKFMTEFEKYTLDQFPLRDSFRSIKSRFHLDVLGQKDNSGIYIAQGYGVKQEYPLNEKSLAHAMERFQYLHDRYLQNCRIFAAVVPDKGYYLAEPSGHLSMDYEALFAGVKAAMPWAEHIDLTDVLSADSYYRTDTHWRQEALLPAAEKIARIMDLTIPAFTPKAQARPFYGVYYGQAALPMEPDTLVTMENDILSACRVYDYETGQLGSVYEEGKFSGKDMYEGYLSGPKSLLTVENSNAPTDRELIVFRDSFGSSLIPLLLSSYSKVTLVDIRYIQSGLLDRYLTFGTQDVLFLYSTLVLNNSAPMK